MEVTSSDQHRSCGSVRHEIHRVALQSARAYGACVVARCAPTGLTILPSDYPGLPSGAKFGTPLRGHKRQLIPLRPYGAHKFCHLTTPDFRPGLSSGRPYGATNGNLSPCAPTGLTILPSDYPGLPSGAKFGTPLRGHKRQLIPLRPLRGSQILPSDYPGLPSGAKFGTPLRGHKRQLIRLREQKSE